MIDRRLATCDAVISGESNGYDIAVQIMIFGLPSDQADVNAILRIAGSWQPVIAAPPAASAQLVERPKSSKEIESDLSKLFAANQVAMAALKPAAQPPQLRTLLHRYQLQVRFSGFSCRGLDIIS